jgi:hypothetical protein
MVAIFALLGAQTGVFARLQASLDSASPATGHGSIVAQGVAEMPIDPIAWRVVLDIAEPLDTAQPVERALGFVVADPDGVDVVDVSAETQERLAPGEASFVPEGAVQTRASLTDEGTQYLRVGLVGEEEAQDAGSDELIFGGEPFAAPTGRRDIDLVRDVIDDGVTSQVTGGEFPVLVIATGGEITVTVGDESTTLAEGEAAQFTGDLEITGAADGSSYVAAVIGPEVPIPPRTTGTITIGVYLCPAGLAPDDLGNPLEVETVVDCEAIADGVPVTLTTPDGDSLSLADAEEVRTGVFSWTALPFGEYVLEEPEELPAGAGDPTIYDSEGTLWINGDAPIDESVPDLHVDLYLFQTGSGSLSVTFYNCPSGWNPVGLDPSGCEVVTDGVDVTLTSGGNGDQLSLSDAEFDGDSSFVWSGLGVSEDAEVLSSGYYLIEETTIPEGYNAVAMSGAHASDGGGGLTYVNLNPVEPDVHVSIMNWITADPVGTITLDTIVCPSAESAPEFCTREFGPTGVSGVYLQDNNGDYGPLTEGNASQEGDGPYVWANLPLGGYSMNTSGLTPPDGYQIIGVVLTPDGTDVSAGIEINEDIAIANIVVLLAPIEEEETPVSGADTDSDGLSDDGEVTFGTDSTNPDSDNDCHLDGKEANSGTDPLDAESYPEGDCDMISETEGEGDGTSLGG